jgi:CTD kinase subunit gamma
MATKENHLEFVRMIQRDILRVVDAVAPADGSGAANVKHVRRVLNGLQTKSILATEIVAEIDACLKERESHPAHLLDLEPVDGNGSSGKPKGESSKGVPGPKPGGLKVDKRQIEQRIEEDRERNKRLRENMWAVPGNDTDEFDKMWDELSELGEDDYLAAEEEAAERMRVAEADN